MTAPFISPDKDKDFRKARGFVFRLLKFRSHSEQELRDTLTAKNLPISTVEQTIRYFKNMDLVNDRLFAQQWISSRLKKPFGLIRIRIELKKKGIEAGIIQEAITEVMDDYEEQAIVTELVQHRLHQYKDIDPEKRKRRIYGYLLRRGFHTNIIMKAIETI